jgi:hypothetical protein
MSDAKLNTDARSILHGVALLVQAVKALKHAYFDDLDKEAVDALESDVIRAREG